MKIFILRLPDVIAQTGLSRSSIYLRISENKFPKPILLGEGRSVGWLSEEVNCWLQQQFETSRGIIKSPDEINLAHAFTEHPKQSK